MCGICGIVGADEAATSPESIQGMTESLAHRGPDGSGTSRDGAVALGHTRLAILDLTPAAAQPMRSVDGLLTLVYNGEIYNFRELRKELEALGHAFRSTSDTEVVLAAYRQWGAGCVERFNGMFALAIWDARERRLFLARDRYGIKPLYYAARPGAFLFASEHKALLRHPGVSRRLDLPAILEYFTFQNIFTDRTFFADIRLLPAAHRGYVRPDEPAAPHFERYWAFRFEEPTTPRSDAEYQEELHRLFDQAVTRQLVSDVEVSTYLSGGVDSGLITSVAAGAIPHIKTFTCGFDLHSASGLELNFDERLAAEHLSWLLNTEHYEVVLKAGDMVRCLPKLAWHMEEPRLGQSYPNFHAAKLASHFAKVILSGTGGDELFGGYPWRYFQPGERLSFETYIDRYYLYWQRLIPNTEIKAAFRPVWSEVSHVWTRDIFRAVFSDPPSRLATPADHLHSAMEFEARTFLHGLLMVEDKLSMAYGLESRVPFLDNDLVDFSMRLPAHLKVRPESIGPRINENEVGKQRKYFQTSCNGKIALRGEFSRFHTPEVCERPKQGFSGPDATWFKGQSIDYVRSVVDDDNFRIYDILDKKTIHDMAGEHLSGQQNRRLLIWSLLYLETWLRQYAD